MKFARQVFLFLGLLVSSGVWSQISHGGSPLFPVNHLLRSSDKSLFIEMPSFDLDSLVKEDQFNAANNLRGSFRFAHKFFTNIEKGKSGLNYTLPDGTKVWQVGIRSEGAYSVNVFFSEYKLPEGAQLFVYNSDRTHVIGAFTWENNSEKDILPIQPVQGDEIIIEYIEPAHAAFEGKLRITEVNHDYVGLRVREPSIDPANSNCMKDIICQIPNDPNANSTLLIIINGTSACTGTLLNNTSENGAPYVLTATHCLNNNFKVINPDYEEVAGTIVAFFNYQRSICGVKSKGTEEMSIAGAQKACVIDTCDISLLLFNERPPDYYAPYYSGWSIEYDGSGRNISISNYPYINIHHPTGGLKKTGHFDSNLTLTSTSFTEYKFLPNSHWLVRGWTEGSTAAGSSGSPIFDSNHRLVGGLSGGNSYCSGANPDGGLDYFFALFRGWDYGNNPVNQLKTYLDPKNSGITHLDGLNPYQSKPLTRLRNADYNAQIPDTLIQTPVKAPATGFLFGHNSVGEITEFAEEFQLSENAEIVGAYFFVPRLTSKTIPSNIRIHLYTGTNKPETLKMSVNFNPLYRSYDLGKDFVDNYPISMNQATSECFVKFPTEINLSGKIFLSYEITYPYTTPFSIHNTALVSSKKNTAWMKYASSEQWIPATAYPAQSMRTSLAIQPLVRYTSNAAIEKVESSKENKIRYNRSTRELTILTDTYETGQIIIYATNGQILEKISYIGNTPVILPQKQAGTISIVRAVSRTNSYSAKIIY